MILESLMVLLSYWLNWLKFLLQGYSNFLPEEKLLKAVEVGQVVALQYCLDKLTKH